MVEVGFLESQMVQHTVIRNIEIIGEAERNVEKHHPDFASGHTDVLWEDM
jgi:uncharacterized protein with HEPN domain